MKQSKRLLLYVYSCLINLFPKGYRAKYREELQAVFLLEMEDAAKKGTLSIMSRGFRELLDFPGAVIRQHLRDRKKGIKQNDFQSDELISRRAILLGMGLFLLALIAEFKLFIFLPFYLGLLAFTLIVTVVGIFKGLPRWALPSIGVFLAALLLIGYSEINLIWFKDRIVTSGNETSRYIYSAFNNGIFWVSLLSFTIVLFLLLVALPRFRLLSRRLKQDWTLLSFTLYGASVVVLLTSWDDYRYLEPYKISAFIFLAMGAWGYLRSKDSRRRLLSLVFGLMLAMITISIGKWILLPQQNWPVWFSWHHPQTERWFESLRTLIELGWMMIMLAMPGLLGILLIKMSEISTSPEMSP